MMNAKEIQQHLQSKDFARIKKILQESPHLLWEPSSYTVMHLASRSMLLEQYTTASALADIDPRFKILPPHLRPNTDWWYWVLKQNKQPEKLYRAQDPGGDTPIDIFLQSWLHPSDERRAAYPFLDSFADSIEIAIQQPDKLQKFVSKPDLRCQDATNCCPVEQVARVYQALAMLCKSADRNMPVLHFLAQIGSCPEPFARLAVAVSPGDVRKIVDGYLPIHLWAVSPRCADPDRDGMLRPLLEAYPESAYIGIQDDQNRLPIHSALEHGKQLEKVKILWEAHPATLSIFDPILELPCCALVSLACRRARRAMRRNVERRNKSHSLSEWLDVTRDIDRLEDRIKCEQLSYIYETLRASPSVVKHML